LKKSNKKQQYADIYLLLNYSTCFGRPSRPSSGVHKTVVAASGAAHIMLEASFFKRDHMVTFEEARFSDSMICTVLQAEACNTDTTPTQPHRNPNTHRIKSNTTNVVIQQNSRKLLMMDILMSETC